MTREISAPNILDAFSRLDLRKDDYVKVIFPSTNVVLRPAEPKYTFSFGNNKIVANFAPWKAEWKKAGQLKTISPPVELFVPSVSVSFSQSKKK